jgi:hypothetical protein
MGEADASLTDFTLAGEAAGQVGDLDLASYDEEFAGFQVGSGDCGDDVGEAGASGDKGEGFVASVRAEMEFVEVFGGDSGSYFVDDWYAGESMAAGFEQVHDVAAGDEEAVRVAEGD